MAKAKVGDIRPIYQQVGWEVCKKINGSKEEEWIPCEKQAEAEILSLQLSSKKKEDEDEEDEEED